MPARPCSTSPRRSSRQAVAGYATTPRRCVSTGTAALPATARPRREQTARGDPIKQRRPEAQGRTGAHSKRAAIPTARQDRGYGVTSALVLVVEAVEALALPLRL